MAGRGAPAVLLADGAAGGDGAGAELDALGGQEGGLNDRSEGGEHQLVADPAEGAYKAHRDVVLDEAEGGGGEVRVHPGREQEDVAHAGRMFYGKRQAVNRPAAARHDVDF